MTRRISLGPNQYFHIYNRGTEKRDIFLNADDYKRFLILLYLGNNTKPVDVRSLFNKGLTFEEILELERNDLLVDIGAYCLMPNHIHLLIKPRKDISASRFLQKIFTGYTMYFNKKNERTGSLFESSFKAKLIESDEYLKYLFAYIHLNPIKLIDPLWKEKGLEIQHAERFLDDYRWSSYKFYTKKLLKDPIINDQEFPEYFETKKDFDDFIIDWLGFTKV